MIRVRLVYDSEVEIVTNYSQRNYNFQGHRYTKPYVSTYKHLPLVPVREWKVEFTLSKMLNNSEVFIFPWTNFYEVKPTGAVEF